MLEAANLKGAALSAPPHAVGWINEGSDVVGGGFTTLGMTSWIGRAGQQFTVENSTIVSNS